MEVRIVSWMLESNLQNAGNKWTSFVHRDEISIWTSCPLVRQRHQSCACIVCKYVCTCALARGKHALKQRTNRAKKKKKNRSIKIHKLSLRVCSRINRSPLCHGGLAAALPNINEESTPKHIHKAPYATRRLRNFSSPRNLLETYYSIENKSEHLAFH